MISPFTRLRVISPTRFPSLQLCRPYSLGLQHIHNHNHVLRRPSVHHAAAPGQIRTAQLRGKKTKASVKLDDLPQGVIPVEPLPLEDAGPTYPTVILQAVSNMRKFENCVLLTRVGGFYELYFEQAEEMGPLLNLKVAQKPTKAGSVPMSGFPFFQLDRYLKTLVQDLSRYVAIAEEFPNDVSGTVKAGGLMHDRRVARIITPGTLIDENFMDPFTNNYVLAIHVDDLPPVEGTESSLLAQSSLPVGLAWLDLSTGHFFTQTTTLSSLPSFLARIGPTEIVLDDDLQKSKDHGIFTVLAEDHHLITYTDCSSTRGISEWTPMLESPVSVRAAEEFTVQEVSAGSTLLQYVETRLQGSNMKLQPPVRQLDMMGIDKNTMRALEIKKTMRDDLATGSLLHTIRRTVTKGGARLLDNWLSSPSTSLSVINTRLDLVTYMLNNPLLRERVTILLKRSHDSHRLLQKFAFGRGDPDDLLALASTIHATQDLVITLSQDSNLNKTTNPPDCITYLTTQISLAGPNTLAKKIKEAIDEEGIIQQQRLQDSEASSLQSLAQTVVTSEARSSEEMSILPKSIRKRKPTSIREHYLDSSEAWIMKPRASPTLSKLHTTLSSLLLEKDVLARDLCTQLGAQTLTLRFTPGLGHICHIKGKDTSLPLTTTSSSSPSSPSHTIKPVSSSKSTRSFHHPLWTSLGQKIDQIKLHIRAEEQRVFTSLRTLVIQNIISLRRNASVLDSLDIACSFALLAEEKGWTRPILNNGTKHKIIGGRHPTVSVGLEEEGRDFVENDCFVGDPSTIWLITGPNMAGKSTFLRQNALITILAQTGSYVPASYASLGIVDQIFSRVGSADNLYRDQSTFMVEMLETATILKEATQRSFVIMDEIGRGTTPNDGTAVAFACLHHLYHVNKCRTLFATHFHDLEDMVTEEKMDGIGFYCTDVEEFKDGSGFRYVHKLREGINKQSHALKVARLAGLPEAAITVAKGVLERDRKSLVKSFCLFQETPHLYR